VRHKFTGERAKKIRRRQKEKRKKQERTAKREKREHKGMRRGIELKHTERESHMSCTRTNRHKGVLSPFH